MRVGQNIGWLNYNAEQEGNAPGLFGYTGSGTTAPVPLTEQGVRAGLHAKSMVIDGNDMRSDNSWVIAPRESMPALADLNYSMGKFSEKLPVFDIWPWPYATSYQLRPECADIAYDDPAFKACAEAVGDFPQVNMGLKGIYTRIITAFGAGLEPIL